MEDTFSKRITESFNRQGFMSHIGARLKLIEKGKVIIECAFNSNLSQQNNYFHAGV